MNSPKQITIRNPAPALTEKLKAIAAERGESLNATILRLLEDAVGTSERERWLEGFATWTEDERVELDEALRAQRQVDEELWR